MRLGDLNVSQGMQWATDRSNINDLLPMSEGSPLTRPALWLHRSSGSFKAPGRAQPKIVDFEISAGPSLLEAPFNKWVSNSAALCTYEVPGRL